MSDGIKIYKIKDFIRMTQTGKLDLERSIQLVRELSFSSDFHKDHNILIDLREADTDLDLTDIIQVSLEFAGYKGVFKNKIAEVIPDTAERHIISRQLKKCMDLQGFQFEQFFDFEAAIEWLSD